LDVLLALLALGFLILVAYRGFSVIMFAPLAAMLPVLLTTPSAVPTVFTGLFMAKMVYFIELYFPVFLLGAIFGKVIELSGFSQSIARAIIRLVGPQRAILSITLVCAVLCYGGVSLFIVVFAVYPFASVLFREAGVPKRLIPATIALGAFSFTMDALPGTPQIQNIIPTAFFHTTTWAAPWLGTIGSLIILIGGVSYLQWRASRGAAEGYGTSHINEPEPPATEGLAPWPLAFLPLVAVGVLNKLFTDAIPGVFGATDTVQLIGLKAPLVTQIAAFKGIWAIEAALILGILLTVALAYRTIQSRFAEGTKIAVGGALLATLNTASEYGFGAVIAALPGFLAVRDALGVIPDPLVNVALSTTILAGITGSASGGLSIALSALGGQFITAAHAAGIPLDVLHRVAAMACGGMDDLPHNGTVITLLAVTGLTHKQSYPDIFVITLIKTMTVFVIIGLYYATGIV